jgi:hypothetical protein
MFYTKNAIEQITQDYTDKSLRHNALFALSARVVHLPSEPLMIRGEASHLWEILENSKRFIK